jgi:beta-aspartyl-peptidase (threonine type)
MKAFIVTHGGVGAPTDMKEGPERAAEEGVRLLAEGKGALEAVIAAAVVLEDDPRTNAGTGSRICIDGKTVEMDAALMTSDGRMGAVAAIREVKNPILVARGVMDTPHITLAGEGATLFARFLGFPPYDPTTPAAREFLKKGFERVRAGTVLPHNRPWLEFAKRYPVLPPEGGCDTIGAVAMDAAGAFASANSTGGGAMKMVGRVGDSPHFGAGLWAGPAGAVATTGIGEHIVRKLVAKETYDRLAAGATAQDAAEFGVTLLPKEIPLGIVVAARDGHGVATNGTLPVGLRVVD